MRAELSSRADAGENAADALRVQFVDLMRDVDDASSAFFAQVCRAKMEQYRTFT